MSREKRQRSKTFTGCWTCRSRRVKCDEQTPSCQRCSQFGVTCEGYGVRLTWLKHDFDEQAHYNSDEEANEHQIQKPKRGRRTFENLNVRPSPHWSSPEIDAMLERIDNCTMGRSRLEGAGFAVFAAQSETPNSQTALAKAPTPLGLEAEPASTTPYFIPYDHQTFKSSNKSVSPLSHTQAENQPGCVGAEPPHIVETSHYNQRQSPNLANLNRPPSDNDCRSHTRTVIDGDSNESSEETSATLVHNKADSLALGVSPSAHLSTQLFKQPPSRHLDTLRIPADQKRLIHHWLTFTSGKLVLVDEPHNPCRTMMLPMALRGLMSSSEDTTADIATFHAICACAAYNLYELGGRKSDQDRALALKHDQQAIRHLRHNLAQADQHQDQSFAMAIMACITIEAISGNTKRWRAHISGGLAYLTKLLARSVEKDTFSAFHTHMVSMAILCGHEVPEDLKGFLQGAESLELSFPYYGASSSFLRNQDRMNTLANSSSHTDQRDLDAFELQLYLDFPTGRSNAIQGAQATILHHMAQAFYYASLVFFQRSVQRVPIDAVQTLVESGLVQLEAIESITKGLAGSVMMWPALVLGSECATPDLQNRAQAWFRKKRSLGFRNIMVLEELASNLWRRRASGDTITRWQDLIAEESFDVFRL